MNLCPGGTHNTREETDQRRTVELHLLLLLLLLLLIQGPLYTYQYRLQGSSAFYAMLVLLGLLSSAKGGLDMDAEEEEAVAAAGRQ